MSLTTNFNVNPYFDDYSDEKGFLRLLFKPGYAVQARELTQLQTVLQKQVNRFGNHIFKNGSLVTGGEFFLHEATYIKIDDTYTDQTTIFVDVNDFDGKKIFVHSRESGNITSTLKEAKVLKVYDSNPGNGDPKTLLVAQTLGDSFDSEELLDTIVFNDITEEINTEDQQDETYYFATVKNTANSSGKALLFSVNEGIFYYDGFFIRNSPQTIAVSKYSINGANASARIGFEVIESIVKNTEDTTLLDPAQDATNYQAPGSDRYKVELILASRDLSSTDTTKFIELMRVEDGKIISQNKFPIYSVLEDTFARRTYDESGNYTVRPFQISLETNSSNSAQTDVILSPGKAYVFGYEFETISPTRITIDKPRESDNVSNDLLSTEYGYFVYTTKHKGTFPINSLATVDLHCVPNSSISLTSSSSINNTKIGTARVKTISFDDSQSSSNSSTYVYRTYLFDVDVTNVTGNVSSSSANGIQIILADGNLSSVEDSYVGSSFRITSGPGSNEQPKVITAWNVATKTITVSSSDPFRTVPTSSSDYSIDLDFGDVESLAIHSGTNIVAVADIDDRSKDQANPYKRTFLSGRDTETLIFELKNDYVKENTISDITYRYKRLFQSVNFTAGAGGLVGTLTPLSGQSFITDNTDSSIKENFTVVITNSSPPSSNPLYQNGSVVPASNLSVGTSTVTIDNPGTTSITANVIATVRVSSGDLSTRRNKILCVGNTQSVVDGTTGTTVVAGNVIVYPTSGEVRIANTYTTRNSNDIQSLFLHDVISIVKIYDVGQVALEQITTSTVLSPNAIDITDRYILDDGQRDSFYDHASLKLKPRAIPPTGNVIVFCKKFIHDVVGGGGFFSVDSYSSINYEDIPTYTSSTGRIYNLRDCIDYRPARKDGVFAKEFEVRSQSFESGPAIPITGEDYNIDYSYYLPRTDKVLLDKDKTFSVVKGSSSLNPIEPKDVETAMTMFVLTNPPYVGNTRDIKIRHIDHRRYTMRDIGRIEKRVENLEYYTTLSLIEQSTLSQQDFSILDSQNLSRFKNGILVDGLTGFAVSDVENLDYVASIDSIKNELRPSFENNSLRLMLNTGTNYNVSSSIITKQSTPLAFIDQPKASLAINVNPFNVLRFDGALSLYPKSDIWVDTTTRPGTVTDLSGDLSAWNLIANSAFSRTFSNWVDNWFGVDPAEEWARTGQQVVGQSTRTITTTTVVPERVTRNLGNRVVDVSIVPFMRKINIYFSGTGFKPNTRFYTFFDNLNVSDRCAPMDRVVIDGTIANFKGPEPDNRVSYQLQNQNDSTIYSSGFLTHVSGNTVHFFATNIGGMPPSSTTPLVLRVNNQSYPVKSYSHYSSGGVSKTYIAGTTQFVLHTVSGAASNSSDYVGKNLVLLDGENKVYKAAITQYNSSTRTLTLSQPLSSTGFLCQYFIEDLKTDSRGGVSGILYIPKATYSTGEKSFRLINNQLNDTGSASSFGDGKFLAQGTVQTIEPTLVSVTVPRTVTTVTTETRPIYYDPLAQTFAVDPITYPRGLFLDKVRLCFKSKSDSLPVRLEIRPTVNGYPNSRTSYPFSVVELTPDRVNITDSPSIDDADSSKYTEFVFPAPVYLLPGEHSIVLISNSNDYEVYCAEIGKIDLVTNQLISDQPYGGSLFKSQNASTWTAEQNIDMMFRLYRHSFSLNPAVVEFVIDYPQYALDIAPEGQQQTQPAIPNFAYDVVSLITGDLEISGTKIKYEFNSYTDDSTPSLTGYKEIVPGTNYELNDSFGRRGIYTSVGNSSFILRATLTSNFDDVSPVIDSTHVGVFLIKNIIDNLGLSNSDIIMANTGKNYSGATVTVTGGGATVPAQPVANIVNGMIDKLYFPTEESRGAGYTSTPTITISSISGTDAVAFVNGETEKNGGNSLVRHLTKTVTLADGFDSADLRVYLTAYKPQSSSIYVYYKVLSESDPEPFTEKKWQLMTQLGPQNVYSIKDNQYREFVYAPGTNGIADNFISYDSYTSFKTFQIKIVMGTDNPTNPPKVTDIRVIALPDGR